MINAVIIAAGEGKRIKHLSGEGPKPLINLLGLTLIERVIFSLRNSGIKNVSIVVGYKGKKLMSYIGNGENYGVKIRYIKNEDYRLGNGTSLLKARGIVKGKFLLLMSDHIFDEDAIIDAIKCQLEGVEAGLLVDRTFKNHIDMKDATKVWVENGKVIEIGKGITRFNGVDCGIFIMKDSVFNEFENINDRKKTLSSLMSQIAHKGKLIAIDFKGKYWIDIDTENELKLAEKILLNSLHKKTDGFISRYMNRALSIRITKFLINTPLTPNSITIMSFFISLLSAGIFLNGSYPAFLTAGILAQLSSIIDGCDGEVARLKFTQTEYGRWLDSILDRYSDAFIIIGMTFGYCFYKGVLSISTILFGFAAMIGSFMNSYTAVKLDTVIEKRTNGNIFRFGRDIRMFLIMSGAILNQLGILLLVLAIVTNFVSIRRILSLKKYLKSS